jgi:hypothetical protein
MKAAAPLRPGLEDTPIKGNDRQDLPERTASSSAGEEDPGAALDDPTMLDAMQAEANLAQKRR